MSKNLQEIDTNKTAKEIVALLIERGATVNEAEEIFSLARELINYSPIGRRDDQS
jgi:hypothetical protein